MARLLVMGSFESSDDKAKIQELLECLAKEIVDQGHHLINGCRNEMDRLLARSVSERLEEKGLDPSKRITCYVSPSREPIHQFGIILKSHRSDWECLKTPHLNVPESVQLADAVILVGGAEGTKIAANWARIARKPILPLTCFGGSSAEIFYEELDDFGAVLSTRIEKSEYEMLNQISSDLAKIAKDTIALAARTVISSDVFVIMSFSGDPKLSDAYESFETICKEYGYKCSRIDDASLMDRIVPEIFSNIKKSAFVIVDLSEPRPNVYYELGFAQGLGKPVIITAYKGTTLPFDVADMPTIFWEGQKQLKNRLREKLKVIAEVQGR